VEPCRDYSQLAQGSNLHCFEIITATMVYYVGENNGGHYHSPALAASGVGSEVAQGWEKAIRQALMPVTPQPSVATAAGHGKDHSEYGSAQLVWMSDGHAVVLKGMHWQWDRIYFHIVFLSLYLYYLSFLHRASKISLSVQTCLAVALFLHLISHLSHLKSAKT